MTNNDNKNNLIASIDILTIANGVSNLLQDTKHINARLKDLEIIIKGDIANQKPSLHQKVVDLETAFASIDKILNEQVLPNVDKLEKGFKRIDTGVVPDLTGRLSEEGNEIAAVQALLKRHHAILKPLLFIKEKVPKIIQWLAPAVMMVIAVMTYLYTVHWQNV
jgi:hypothetical protein